MKSNDLEQIIFEAESWICRLKALRVKHEAPTVRGVPFDYASLPTFEQATGYTAVDMTTAAAQGFRDGVTGVVVDLPKRVVDWSTDNWADGYNLALERCKAAIIAAGGQVAE